MEYYGMTATLERAAAPTLDDHDYGRVAFWDPRAECTMVMASPSAAPLLFAEYHRGAVEKYARFGVGDLIDADVQRCADDTALFWALVELDGRVVGGVRGKGPLRSPEDSHAIVEWAGQPGASDVRELIAERLPLGVMEMKAAWLTKDPVVGRHRAKMIARTAFHAMALLDIDFCMATSAAHSLDQWRSSGGVVAAIPATPYPNERYQTKMMWWDRRTFAAHGEPDQVAATFREMANVRRSRRARRAEDLIQPVPPTAPYPPRRPARQDPGPLRVAPKFAFEESA